MTSSKPAMPSEPTIGLRSVRASRSWFWAAALLGTITFACVAVVISGFAIKEAARDMRGAILEATSDMRAVARDIEVMVPPDNDKLFTILSKGVGVTEYAVKTSTVGTTPTSAFTTDLTTTPYNQQTDAYTQEFTVRNLDASSPAQDLCWKPIAWASAGANCAAKCAAAVATITCTGASTDGALVTSGQSVSRRFDGTSCVCVVADTAGTAFQTERIVR